MPTSPTSADLLALASAAPALDTERLTLRGHRREDFEESVALWGDPVVTRYIGKLTREEVWGRFLRHLGHWAVVGFGSWVVRERATGRFVGEVALADLHRGVAPEHAASFTGVPEAGWVLAPWCHGRGFATEAMTAVLQWAETALGAPRVVCMIDPDNAASKSVARKLGFQQYAETPYRGETVLLFERLTAARNM